MKSITSDEFSVHNDDTDMSGHTVMGLVLSGGVVFYGVYLVFGFNYQVCSLAIALILLFLVQLADHSAENFARQGNYFHYLDGLTHAELVGALDADMDRESKAAIRSFLEMKELVWGRNEEHYR
ncbi:hypothetical protein [Aeromonas veronii]|uniref:Uncharacterized protein n=1 Tax=Aeromonas veronii TaxID=654 RepID=A0A4S5CHB5_AERVE|nr:hypothetical protein [Aeromonas veronii]THJ45070.1 hypothetical protein E8Q35_12880 [Aeromonas veronii]